RSPLRKLPGRNNLLLL
ncbi:hypothetical protein BN1723_020884, partial [Verticillium longisporum]